MICMTIVFNLIRYCQKSDDKNKNNYWSFHGKEIEKPHI